ncbi:MAG: TetR/AcrR family transcriptional regulator [Anaerolineaceae bacterium]|nr:TetR/AcrR family transcriptional regulator [Anaerolineaceae bacterium]
MSPDYATEIVPLVLELEARGLVTRTFRRLDPDRQQAVIDAIMTEAAERGPAEINIKQVAARAGVSVGSLYQYFGSREKLLEFSVELVTRLVTGLFSGYAPMLAEMPLSDGLSAYLQGGLEWAESSEAGLVRFFAKAAYQGDPALEESVVRPLGGAMRSMVEAMMDAARQRGELRENLDLEAVGRVINALLVVLGDAQLLPYLNSYFQLYDEAMTPERILSACLDLIIRGVRREQVS